MYMITKTSARNLGKNTLLILLVLCFILLFLPPLSVKAAEEISLNVYIIRVSTGDRFASTDTDIYIPKGEEWALEYEIINTGNVGIADVVLVNSNLGTIDTGLDPNDVIPPGELVTAVGAHQLASTDLVSGTVTVTAKTQGTNFPVESNKNYSFTTKVSVALNESTLNLIKGQSRMLTATVTPQTAEQTVEWSSSDTNVATVTGGRVEAVGTGIATITATPVAYGDSDSCTVLITGIAPESAVFDQYPRSTEYKDISIELTQGGYTLMKITCDNVVLTPDIEYTINGNVYTFQQPWLATLNTGSHTIVFDVDNGTGPALMLTVNDSTPLGPVYTNHVLKDLTTGVSVTGYFTADAELHVKQAGLHAENSCAACDEIRAQQSTGNIIFLHDISLTGDHQGDMEVSIPVGTQYNGHSMKILHCANGVLETKTLTVLNGNAAGVFSSLSPFAIVKAQDAPMPQTGDSANPVLWLGLIGAGGLGVLQMLLLKKKWKQIS